MWWWCVRQSSTKAKIWAYPWNKQTNRFKKALEDTPFFEQLNEIAIKREFKKCSAPLQRGCAARFFGATWLECDDDALAANFSIKQLLNVWWVRCIGYKSLLWKLKSREMTGCYSTAAATHWTRIENVIYLVKFMFSKKTTKFDDM